jgi:succinyl-CoA synthetase alpha subunit
MGHAGAFVAPGEPDALTKIKALRDVGVTMVNHPEKFGDAMKRILGESGRASTGASLTGASQRRSMHTLARRLHPVSEASSVSRTQKRNLSIRESQAFDILAENEIPASKQMLLAVGVDRSSLSPAVIVSPASASASTDLYKSAAYFPFDYRLGFDASSIPAIAAHLKLPSSAHTSLSSLINKLVTIFKAKEAFLLETKIVNTESGLVVTNANFGFDDAAFRSAKRQGDIHALRKLEDSDPQELEAEQDGIVYIKLAGSGNIGTLVNGAGLAMNTVDALADAGGKAANFLDTGGKATSETVKKSFQVILSDPRVKAIFVNIFGGLTLGDMIANGVLLAFKELDMKIPVVVRIRGTNEEEGQKIVSLVSEFDYFSVSFWLFQLCFGGRLRFELRSGKDWIG